MKWLEYLEISSASIALMIYGFLLGQTKQSMQDLAGILMFITGVISLAIAFAIHFFARKKAWANTWYTNILKGVIGCAVVFTGIVIYARISG